MTPKILSQLGGLPPVVKWVLDRCLIETDDVNDCFIWRQATTRVGRPVGTFQRVQISPQRAVYEAMVRRLGKRKIALSCGESRCCNWRHMEALEHRTMMRRAVADGRIKSGLLRSVKYLESNRARRG